MPALLLVLAFIVVPLAELAVIIEVGQAIGLPATIAILLADSLLGAMLLRSQGRATWRRFNESMGAGRVPHREALDGGLVIFGGALLLTPGFITDVLGLLLLIPPTRRLGRRLLSRLIARRMLAGFVFRAGGRGRTGTRRDYDVEGSASEVNGSPPGSSRSRLER